MKKYAVGAVVIVTVVWIALLVLCAKADACIGDVGTATSDVFVRDIDTGAVVGSLYKGDSVIVKGKTTKGMRSLALMAINISSMLITLMLRVV